MKTFQCPLPLSLSDVLSLFQFLFLSPAMEQSSSVSCSHFLVSMYLFISFLSHLPRRCCDISTFPIFISLSFHSASQLIPIHFFLILFWFLCPCLPHHHLSSFHFSLSHEHNHAPSDVHLAPHLSLTCGNLCGMHHPTALLDKNVGNITLISMHAIRLWVFLAL